MVKLTSWGLTNRCTAKLSKQINLSKTRTLMVRWRLLMKTLRSCKGSLDAPLMGSREIQGPKAKNGGAAPGQILDLYLFRRFPLTLVEFGCETRSIGKVMKLSFRAYEERPNPSPYATWATVLVQTVPDLRDRLELDFDWASNLTWTSMLVLSASYPYSTFFQVLSNVPNHNEFIR